MKLLILAAASIIALNIGSAIAQTNPSAATMHPFAPTVSAQSLLVDYVAKYKSTKMGAPALEAIFARGLEIKRDNVILLRNSWSEKVPDDEKVVLVRLLGSMHSHDNKSGMNDLIARDLRGIIYTGNKNVGRAATFSFSRLGFSEDTTQILHYAEESGFITSDERFGELAHIVRFAPARAQLNILATISESKGKYAAEILANVFSDSKQLGQLSPEAQIALQSILVNNEPTFPMATSEIGHIDALRYAQWLHTSALANSVTSKGSYDDFVIKQLNSKDIDPRKILAYLTSDRGKKMISNIAQPRRFSAAFQRAAEYANSFPQSTTVAQFLAELKHTLDTSKK